MVSKEFLNKIDVKNIFFRNCGGITSIITLILFDSMKATIFCSSEITENGILIIDRIKENFQKERIEIFVTAIKDYSQNNTWTLFFEDPLPEDFENKVNKLNNLLQKSEKRKEFRYEIGLENWKDFGLSSPAQLLTVDNHSIKCIISNASIHGALLTGERSLIKIGSKANLICHFSDKKVKLNCIVINASIAATNYYRYSIRFLEPLSLSWCNHIIEYGDLRQNPLY